MLGVIGFVCCGVKVWVLLCWVLLGLLGLDCCLFKSGNSGIVGGFFGD